VAQHPKSGLDRFIIEVHRSHTDSLTHTHTHTQQDSSERASSSPHSPLQTLPTKTQEMNIHDLSGIRTRNSRILSPADLYLRQHGHWDPFRLIFLSSNFLLYSPIL